MAIAKEGKLQVRKVSVFQPRMNVVQVMLIQGSHLICSPLSA